MKGNEMKIETIFERIAKKRIRTCYTLHHCNICNQDIVVGQRYHDGGHGMRAHVDCISFPDDNKSSKPNKKKGDETMDRTSDSQEETAIQLKLDALQMSLLMDGPVERRNELYDEILNAFRDLYRFNKRVLARNEELNRKPNAIEGGTMDKGEIEKKLWSMIENYGYHYNTYSKEKAEADVQAILDAFKTTFVDGFEAALLEQ